MMIAVGTQLGPYEITGTLGAGGMGEVYRAKDARLGREVAIKVLPQEVSSNPDALARFQREARAVAALSHPNIMAIHDFGMDDGTAYAVTELVEGETLKSRVQGAPLPVRKVLDYGAQIAQGLAAAHENGVTHRDLKPDNIIITHDGRVKILDFGLAKVEETAENEVLTASPTVDLKTRPGTIMGTMGYMSPEQVRGQMVDARSDIFSFGTVLYEMLSGRKAFSRQTSADTLSAILNEDPPALSETAVVVPPALQRIIHHCLEKNPAERFQSARDLAFHLEAVGSVSDASMTAASSFSETGSNRGKRSLLLFVAGLMVGALAAWLAATNFMQPEQLEPPSLRYLSYTGHSREPSASPDGRLIAYSSSQGGVSRIWLKQIASGDEIALTQGPYDRMPRISPDGSQVLFESLEGEKASLFKVSVVGGEPRKVMGDAQFGDWSPDGSQIAFLRTEKDGDSVSMGLWRADATDGQGSRKLATVNRARLVNPRWSPDGNLIAVVEAGAENGHQRILLVPADGGDARALEPPPPAGRLSTPAWVGDGGQLVYAQSQSLTLTSGEQGAGRLILQDVASGEASVRMWLPDAPNVLDIQGEGSLTLGVLSSAQNLAEVKLDDNGTSSPRWLNRGSSGDRQPIYSPDGKWLLFSSNRGGNLDLWKMDPADGSVQRITEDPANDWDPSFTPDGKHILWSSNRTGHFEIWICDSDGTGARQLSQDGVDAENATATSDGKWIVYNSSNPVAPGIWKMRPDGTGAEILVPGSWSTPDVSPDGKYVAFRRGFEPRAVHVARVEDGKQVFEPAVLPGGIHNGRPRWMHDSRSLIFTGSDETGAMGLYIQDFVPEEDTSASRRPLAEFVLNESPESFAVSPDGTRMVLSLWDVRDSLMLAEGLADITPPMRR